MKGLFNLFNRKEKKFNNFFNLNIVHCSSLILLYYMHALNRTFKREDTFARLQLLRNAPFLETRVYKMLINIQICGAHVVMKISVGCGEESRCCNLLVAVFSNIPFSCRGALLYYVDILFLIMSAPPHSIFRYFYTNKSF